MSKHVFLGLLAFGILVCNAPASVAQTQASSQASSESGGVPFTPETAPVPIPAKKEVTTTQTQQKVDKKTTVKAAVKPKVVNYHWKTKTSTTTNHRKY